MRIFFEVFSNVAFECCVFPFSLHSLIGTKGLYIAVIWAAKTVKPRPQSSTFVSVVYSHHKHPKNLGREFNRGHCLSHSGAPAARRPPSGATYPYRKEKGTHELIFSWLSWLAVLLMGTYARRRRRRCPRWLPYSRLLG